MPVLWHSEHIVDGRMRLESLWQSILQHERMETEWEHVPDNCGIHSSRGRHEQATCVQVLNVLEERIQCKVYGAFHVKAILSFETESVPVQQFQARVAEMVIMHGGRGLLSCEADFEPILNLALRVRTAAGRLQLTLPACIPASLNAAANCIGCRVCGAVPV